MEQIAVIRSMNTAFLYVLVKSRLRINSFNLSLYVI